MEEMERQERERQRSKMDAIRSMKGNSPLKSQMSRSQAPVRSGGVSIRPLNNMKAA